ncbi:MAG: response regulator transcription factor, partial [Oligoflexales bacterium]|nr:response regulator transcription factor [Oligoflexales bacterium]
MERLTTRMLVIDEDKNFIAGLKREFPDDFVIEAAVPDESSIKKFKEFSPHVVIVCNDNTGGSHVDLLLAFKEIDRHVIRVVVAPEGHDERGLIEGVNKADIHGYFRKPVSFNEIQQLLRIKTANYHVVKSFQVDRHKADEAYGKLKSIFDDMERYKEMKKEGEMLIHRASRMESMSMNLLDDFVDKFKTEVENQEEMLQKLVIKIEANDNEQRRAKDLSQKMFKVVKDDLLKDLVEIKRELADLVKEKAGIDSFKAKIDEENNYVAQNLAEFK